MKRLGILPVLASLSLALLVNCPASLAQATGSYDFSDNSGDAYHTNAAITGGVHDNMGYNWNTNTGTGNSQNATNGGQQVQVYSGLTVPQKPGSLNYATQSLLSGMLSTYPFASTSVGIAYGSEGTPLTYGFNQSGNIFQNSLLGPLSSIIGSSLGVSLGGYGLYTGVDYYRELMNGNTNIGGLIPTPLSPTGTSSVSANTVSPESYGGGAFPFTGLGSASGALGLIGGYNNIMGQQGPGQVLTGNPPISTPVTGPVQEYPGN
jgi:hypothetical protein